jgi:hypothetical protein
MLESSGIPPRLSGQKCQELICQQYWYRGKLEKELDMLFIMVNDRWHVLYFENEVIYWRHLQEEPTPFSGEEEDLFKYPHIDLAARHNLKGEVMEDCELQSMPDGSRVIIIFEQAGRLILSCTNNETHIQYLSR